MWRAKNTKKLNKKELGVLADKGIKAMIEYRESCIRNGSDKKVLKEEN